MKPHYLILISTFITFFSTGLVACENARVSLQVLGSGGPELNDQRASSSYLIWIDKKATILIDTGTGSSLNFEKAGAKVSDLKAILYTHFHADHSAALPAYIKGSFFTDKADDLLVFGPEGNSIMPSATEFIGDVIGKEGAYQYLSNYVEKDKQSSYKIKVTDIPLTDKTIHQHKISDSINVSAIKTHHGPLPAIAWRVDTHGCSITFSGDMSNQYQTLSKLAKDSDLLIAHNAVPEEAKGVARKLHMPPSEIGKIANAANVKKLILSHRMERTLGTEQDTTNFVKKNYTGPVFFAEDMDVITP